MKKLSLGLVLFSVAALADVRVTPNMYTCEGDQTSFNYTTTSFTGKPTIQVTYEGREIRFPAEVQINVEQSRIGNIVSVSDFRPTLVDGPEMRYSIVLPSVELADMTKGAEFNTVVIRTVVANPFMRPTPFTGTVHHNEFVNVKCTAQRVFF